MLSSIEKINKIQQYLPKIQKIINTTNHSSLTTHHKTNYQHHKYRILQILKQKLLTMSTPSTHFFIIKKLKKINEKTPNLSQSLTCKRRV